MNLLINFSTLKKGGGQNVALNFLHAIESCPMPDVILFYLVAKDSDVHEYLKRKNARNYIVVTRNPLLRIIFEAFVGWYFLAKYKIDIVYSYFGYAWFPKWCLQVSGSADANLYFPEIDFWSGHSRLGRLKRWILDFYRLFGVKRANAVVFENAIIEERAKSLYGLENTRFIMPSIYFNETKSTFCLPSGFCDAKRGLFLCGWQLNKNIMLIPSLAAEMRKRGVSFQFVLTAPLDNSRQHKQFCDLVIEQNVGDMVFVVGLVKKDELSSLYAQIDFVFLLSKLESFSNNIIEAWQFRKPLIVADELWSRAICQDAAVYVGRDSEVDIADKLCRLIEFPHEYQHVVDRGSLMLQAYPSIQERINQETEYIRYVYKHA